MDPRRHLFSPVQRALFMKRISPLSELGAGELLVLARNSWLNYYPEGATIVKRGALADSLVLIVKGTLRLDGGEGGIEEITGERMLGMLDLFAYADNPADAVAASPVLTLEIDAEDLRTLLEDRFVLLHYFLRMLAARVVELQRDGLPDPWSRPVHLETTGRPDLVERILLLNSAVPLRHSHVDTMVEIAAHSRQVLIPRGTRLWSAGDRSEHMDVILKGRILCRTPDGHESSQGAGRLAGALEAFANAPRWYDAEAETDLEALRLSLGYVLDLLEDHFEVADDLLAFMARTILAPESSSVSRTEFERVRTAGDGA